MSLESIRSKCAQNIGHYRLSGHVSPVCATDYQVLRDSRGAVIGTIAHEGSVTILRDRRGKVLWRQEQFVPPPPPGRPGMVPPPVAPDPGPGPGASTVQVVVPPPPPPQPVEVKVVTEQSGICSSVVAATGATVALVLMVPVALVNAFAKANI